eukprot:TRINITY_DN4705_c0_g1_i11.p1 TRINITY_DN4705_c0_g1~~TRINITY_DN4705_c0_g1_i11.p1  ORF type:complete len:258 (-),score=60.66 TRINITY_DN4705_c0_g1_i11:36-809(-)
MAPEALEGRGYKGFTSDVWGAGVILYAMIYGTMPFRAGSPDELRTKILAADFSLSNTVSEEARDLIRKMLSVDPENRCTIPQALRHVWFNGYDECTSLFDDKEIKDINNELIYNKEDTDCFMKSETDLNKSDLCKNNTSNSVILAPYNSVKQSTEESIVCATQPIKFAPKVKGIDRRYEMNNNCELDNGVYNRFVQQAKQSESTNKGKKVVRKKGRVDREVVEEVAELGYPKDYITKSLEESAHNYATTTYYLLNPI